MTNVTTANKRAAQLANDHAATREALDAANDTLGKMCLALSKAGLTGDALAGVQRLVAERDLVHQECKDLNSSLDWREALARRHLWPNVPLATDKKLVVATEREAQASGQAKSALDLRSLSDARSSLSKWQTWGRNKIGVNATVSDENLRNAIDDYAGAQIAGWKAEAKRTFTQLQEAYDAMNNGHEALAADAKEALDYLIAPRSWLDC
jgi:hypothetical protein